MVAEGPNMNIGIITHDNEIVVSLLPAVMPFQNLIFICVDCCAKLNLLRGLQLASHPDST